MVNGSGDQFFLPDSSRFYFHDLIGQKSLRYIPNTDHGLNGSALDSLEAFYLSILESKPMPEFSWSIFPVDGRIAVKTSTVPLEVKMWRAGRQPIGSRFQARNHRLCVALHAVGYQRSGRIRCVLGCTFQGLEGIFR